MGQSVETRQSEGRGGPGVLRQSGWRHGSGQRLVAHGRAEQAGAAGVHIGSRGRGGRYGGADAAAVARHRGRCATRGLHATW